MRTRIRASSTAFALVALGAGACSAYAFGCGSNQSTSGTADAGHEAAAHGPVPAAGNLQCSAETADWPMFGQNVCNTNSQGSAGGIDVTSARTLGVKCIFDNAHGAVSATPDVVGRALDVP